MLAKDAGDLWRLLATSNGRVVRSTFDAQTNMPECGEAVTTGIAHVAMLIADDELAALATKALGPNLTADDIDPVIERWAAQFLH